MTKIKHRISFKELKLLGILPWGSWKTTKRKIDKENFPAYKVSGYYSFDPNEVEMWLKKRKVISKAA